MMVAAKSPQPIRLTKVKAYTTEEMVETGEVRAEEKQGNDEADQVAELRSKRRRPQLYHLAKLGLPEDSIDTGSS